MYTYTIKLQKNKPFSADTVIQSHLSPDVRLFQIVGIIILKGLVSYSISICHISMVTYHLLADNNQRNDL